MPNEVSKPAPVSASPWSHRVPIAVALTIAACVVWPTVAHRQRERLAERLAERALNSSGARCTTAVRELSLIGVAATEPLVRLAASQREELAVAAQEALLNQLTSWQIEFESRQSLSTLRLELEALAGALQKHASQFGGNGRRWAQRVASQLLDVSKPLGAESNWTILAACEHVLDLPAPARKPPSTSTVSTQNTPANPSPGFASDEPALPLEPSPVTALATPLAELAVVMDMAPAAMSPAAPPPLAKGPGNSLRSPVTPAVPTIPTATVEHKAPAAPAIAATSQVTEVPSPQQQRRLRRRLRSLSDQQLVMLLEGESKYEAAAARQVLADRGYSAGMLQTLHEVETLSPADRRAALERAATLPPAEARRLLRRLVNDDDPEIRLLALTQLATTGDAQLEEIARERAVEDADPRVADLAAKLIQQVK